MRINRAWMKKTLLEKNYDTNDFHLIFFKVAEGFVTSLGNGTKLIRFLIRLKKGFITTLYMSFLGGKDVAFNRLLMVACCEIYVLLIN